MNKACEIFTKVSPELAQEVVRFIKDAHKDVYRAALGALAQQRKLRPQFVQKKSGPEQVTWMVETLKSKSSEAIGEQLLQVWLMKGRIPMLVQFLDAVGVKHNGEGAVDDLPETLDEAAVKTAVDGLLEKFPAQEVALYLEMFQLQQNGGWPAVAKVLAEEPRLKL